MQRTRSRPEHNPTTGADLGAGPGAGRMTDEDLGGAADMAHATRMVETAD
jgi:Mn-containing catalase